jgi:hypothetical protein
MLLVENFCDRLASLARAPNQRRADRADHGADAQVERVNFGYRGIR